MSDIITEERIIKGSNTPPEGLVSKTGVSELFKQKASQKPEQQVEPSEEKQQKSIEAQGLSAQPEESYILLRGKVRHDDDEPILKGQKEASDPETREIEDNEQDDFDEIEGVLLSIAQFSTTRFSGEAPLVESDEVVESLSFNMESRELTVNGTAIRVDKEWYRSIMEHTKEIGGRDIEMEISDDGKEIDIREVDKGEIKRVSAVIVKDPENDYEVFEFVSQ